MNPDTLAALKLLRLSYMPDGDAKLVEDVFLLVGEISALVGTVRFESYIQSPRWHEVTRRAAIACLALSIDYSVKRENGSPVIVQLPSMRESLIWNLFQLSDFDFQHRFWLDRFTYDSVDDPIHFIFDDSTVAEEGFDDELMDVIYADATEPKLVMPVVHLLDKLIHRLGDLDSAAYMSAPEWPEIRAKARAAYEYVRRNRRGLGSPDHAIT